MPHIGDWWDAVSETVRATFLTLLQDIPSFSPIFLLSTSETMYSELPEEVKCIFRIQYEEVLYVQRPIEEDRRKFFQELILHQASMAPPRRKHTGKSKLFKRKVVELRNSQVIGLGGKHFYPLSSLTGLDGHVENGYVFT